MKSHHGNAVLVATTIFIFALPFFITKAAVSIPVAPTIHATSHVGGYSAIKQSFEFDLSLSGGTQSKPVASWALDVPCPGSVTVQTSSNNICGSTTFHGAGSYGNAPQYALLVRNYSSGIKNMTIGIRTLNGSGSTTASTTLSLIIPSTFTDSAGSTSTSTTALTTFPSTKVSSSSTSIVSKPSTAVYSYSCSTFTRNLTVGSPMTVKESSVLADIISDPQSGDVVSPATVFNSSYKAALMKFQEDNAVPNTGFFGHLTRNKISALNGCAPEANPETAVKPITPIYSTPLPLMPVIPVCPIGYTCVLIASTTVTTATGTQQ